MQETPRLYSLAAASDADALRHGSPAAVRAALLATRERTLRWAQRYEQAFGSAHPAIAYDDHLNPPWWELGHVAWFQEWWIGRNRQRDVGAACNPEHARKPSLLPQVDAWYDSSRVAHETRWTLSLPDAPQAREYLARTLAQTLDLLDALPAQASDDQLYFFRLVALHEDMHAEAAAYMADALGIGCGVPAVELPPTEALQLSAARFRIGRDGPGFSFDNELLAHAVDIGAFEIDSQPVTWARFLPFVEEHGYERDEFWSAAGRKWRLRTAAQAPARLRREGGEWQQRHGREWRPINLAHAAIHLTAHEAEAWCRWAGRRLPSEAEWEYAARTHPRFTWGAVWEWTASDFAPYPGFVPHPYRDYSQPWFGTRRVLRGAAAATSPALAHPSYRNFFEPHRHDIYAGFRSCRTTSEPFSSRF